MTKDSGKWVIFKERGGWCTVAPLSYCTGRAGCDCLALHETWQMAVDHMWLTEYRRANAIPMRFLAGLPT